MHKAADLEEQLEAAAEAHTAAVQGLRQQVSELEQKLASSASRESSLKDDLQQLKAFAARCTRLACCICTVCRTVRICMYPRGMTAALPGHCPWCPPPIQGLFPSQLPPCTHQCMEAHQEVLLMVASMQVSEGMASSLQTSSGMRFPKKVQGVCEPVLSAGDMIAWCDMPLMQPAW